MVFLNPRTSLKDETMRYVTIVLFALVAFSLVGCGDKDHSSTVVTVAPTSDVGQWRLFYEAPFNIWVKQTRQTVYDGGVWHHTGNVEINYPYDWYLDSYRYTVSDYYYGQSYTLHLNFLTPYGYQSYNLDLFYLNPDPYYHHVYVEYGAPVTFVRQLPP